MTITSVYFQNHFIFVNDLGQKIIYHISYDHFYTFDRSLVLSLKEELDRFLDTDDFKNFMESNKEMIIDIIQSRVRRYKGNYSVILNYSEDELVKKFNPVALYSGKLLKELVHLAINQDIIENIIT